MPETQDLEIYTDGASRGNPGHAAYAFLFVKGGRAVLERSEYLGIATNNTAEYRAIIAALTEASRQTDGPVRVYSDSELVVRQITGAYRVNKEHLRELKDEVLRIAGQFTSVTFVSVRRTDPWIGRADELCNRELDARRGR
ncbi:ribonuclease HI family protein [Methanofollis tationis]|uniref:Ribonuclease HI family protein n=1 Tax=Methanofollis tationis TaxID=81417 RepID=A0A7K4HQN1_9EURY|nr:ribonuclease HI family protein [Methanofollis tationis]NVO67357.1 ribonuclease HI family protein [Methanofollis tationis]